MNRLLLRFSGMISVLALIITTTSANVTCGYYAYQPKLPENAKNLRKF